MPQPTRIFIALLFAIFCLQLSTPTPLHSQMGPELGNNNPLYKPKIQVAILLDVSNSMDGLIGQAKNQLWNIVRVIGKIRCNGEVPVLEIALYEFGRSNNDPQKGYIEQVSGFTNDLDKFYHQLNNLMTQGGDEFCGHVISTSVDSLKWDTSPNSYKVIFIAGNESFLQGTVPYTEACSKVKQKNIIVNTIYCGSKERGLAESWNLGSECGNGDFSYIDQDATPIQIPTPYDSALFVLNKRLNANFVPYGKSGSEGYDAMMHSDTVATYNSKDIDKIVGYVVVKADSNLYRSKKWNLVDAYEADPTIFEKIEENNLPQEYVAKSLKERKEMIEVKLKELKEIRKAIKEISGKRDQYVIAEKAKNSIPVVSTLGSEVELIIKQQVSRYNMHVE